MVLKELIHFEEKILLCDYNNKFSMPFSDIVIMDKFLTEIENITNLYFQLVDDYKRVVNKKDLDNDKKVEILKEFNEKLLNENVEFDFKPYETFIDRYIEKK